MKKKMLCLGHMCNETYCFEELHVSKAHYLRFYSFYQSTRERKGARLGFGGGVRRGRGCDTTWRGRGRSGALQMNAAAVPPFLSSLPPLSSSLFFFAFYCNFFTHRQKTNQTRRSSLKMGTIFVRGV